MFIEEKRKPHWPKDCFACEECNGEGKVDDFCPCSNPNELPICTHCDGYGYRKKFK